MPKTNPLLGLLGALREVEKVDWEMPLQTLNTLLHVHRRPGLTHSDLAAALNSPDGVSTSAITRIVSRLSERQSVTRAGLGLLVSEIDPTNRKFRQLWLTPKGQALVKRILSHLE